MEKDYPNFPWKISIVGNVIMNIIVRMNTDFETWFVSFVCQMVFNICSNSLLVNKQTANKNTNSAIIKLNYRKHITSGEKKSINHFPRGNRLIKKQRLILVFDTKYSTFNLQLFIVLTVKKIHFYTFLFVWLFFSLL